MKNKVFKKYSFILFVFLSGSFLGFVHENIEAFLEGRYMLKKGLIYEPLIPIYGIGLLVFYFLYKHFKPHDNSQVKTFFKTFLIGFVAGSMVEYFASVCQEAVFGTVSWNYTYMKFHLNGRINLLFSCFWGLAGALFYKYLLPLYKSLEEHFATHNHKILVTFLSVVLLADCTLSTIACLRQSERREGIVAQNRIDELLDIHYPDEYLNKIYTNARVLNR